MAKTQQDEHEFMVAGVERPPARWPMVLPSCWSMRAAAGFAFTSARTWQSCFGEQVSTALEKLQGPVDEGMRPEELNSSNDE